MYVRTVYKWLMTYHYGGWEALKSSSISDQPPKLSGKQMQWLAKTVNDKNPLQLKLVNSLLANPDKGPAKQRIVWLLRAATP